MEIITLKDYFENGNDIFTMKLNNDYHIYIDNMGYELCVEICDNNGDCVNIGWCVDIHLNTFIEDIKTIVIDYLIDNYFANNI